MTVIAGSNSRQHNLITFLQLVSQNLRTASLSNEGRLKETIRLLASRPLTSNPIMLSCCVMPVKRSVPACLQCTMPCHGISSFASSNKPDVVSAYFSVSCGGMPHRLVSAQKPYFIPAYSVSYHNVACYAVAAQRGLKSSLLTL